MAHEFMYRAGGNPPRMPGLYDDRGHIVAMWPIEIPVTPENIEAVVKLVWARDDERAPVSRYAITVAIRGY